MKDGITMFCVKHKKTGEVLCAVPGKYISKYCLSDCPDVLENAMLFKSKDDALLEIDAARRGGSWIGGDGLDKGVEGVQEEPLYPVAVKL